MICVVFLSSCSGRREMDTMLDMADSIMEASPDSAYSLLDRCGPLRNGCSKPVIMRYELLRAKAQNKAGIGFTSDSTMKEVASWYEAHGDASGRVMAAYLLGCVYRDLGDAPMALKHYNHAVFLADTTRDDCDWHTLCRIHGQMAELFHGLALSEYELKEVRLAIAAAWKAKDTLTALSAYDYMSNTYYAMYEEDSVISVTNKAVDMYEKYGRSDLAACTLPTMIYVCLNRKDYDKAKAYMDYFEQKSQLFDADGNIRPGRELYYHMKSRYYHAVGKKDSAFVYTHKLQKSTDDIMCMEAACQDLMNLYMEEGRADSVMKYARLYCHLNDSSAVVKSADEIIRMQSFYNYGMAQQQMIEKTEEAGRYRLVLICGAFAVLVALFLSYSAYSVRKRKQSRILQNKNAEYARLLAEYMKSSDELSRVRTDLKQYQIYKESEVKQLHEAITHYQGEAAAMEKLDSERELVNCELARRLHLVASKGQIATMHDF